MNVRLARAITALYPAGWRRRYGDEFVELLHELPPSAAAIVDASLPALAQRARDAGLAVAIAVCVAVPVGASLQHEPQSAPRTSAYSPLPNDSGCRAYSSVSATRAMEQRRCWD